MSWIDGLKHRIRTVLDPGAYERELQDEMRLHEELDSMQQRDAKRARRRFGNRTYYQEETRRMTWLGFLDVLRQDASYAWRSLRRTPAFTTTVIVTLALGIGLNAAMFTFLDRLLLRPPLGVENPGSLRRIWVERFNTSDGVPLTYQGISYPAYLAFRDVAGKTADIAYFNTSDGLSLGRDKSGPPVHGVYATSNYFEVLGVKPALGRFYAPDEDVMGEGANVAVVSHVFWKTRLAGDSAILGKPIAIGPRKYVVIGIAQPSFVGLDMQPADIWIPLGAFPVPPHRARWFDTFTTYGSRTVMRVRPGFSDTEFARRATAAIRDVDRLVNARHPDTLLNVSTGSIVEARGPGKLDRGLVVATRLGGVAIIVLLIASANVVNLLLARAVHRRREIAVRLALGISRMRLVRLLTTEMLLLALVAGAAAILAAWWGGGILRALILPNIEWVDSPLDGRVALFTIGVAMLTGLAAGIVPAVQASNPRLGNALKAGDREGSVPRSRLRSALVVTQAALSMVLLVGAALFVRSLQNVQSLEIGFDADRTVVANPQFYLGETPPDSVVARAMQRIAERLEGRPGVEAVARSRFRPMQGSGGIPYFSGADSLGSHGRQSPAALAVSPEYFRAVGARFLDGSTFSSRREGINEVVVNEAMAKLFWPGRSALGQCIRFNKRDDPCHTVVGIVANSRLWNVIEDEAAAQYYLPLGGHWLGSVIVARVAPGTNTAVAAELRSAIRREFPMGYTNVSDMAAILEPEYRPWRMGASLFTAFGVLALLVAIVGIYSTVAYGVNQRTREFGIRVALGARVADVLVLVVGEGMRVVALGVGIGIALALASSKLIAAMLYQVSPTDARAFLFVSMTLLVVAALAALLPAWRAAQVDPVTALRAE